jgi:hypothetical protein
MGTAQVAFVKVERVEATGSHVTRSDVSHVTGNDRKSRDRKRPCPEPKEWHAHAQPKITQYPP